MKTNRIIKWLLPLLLILAGFAASAQSSNDTTKYVWYRFQYGTKHQRVQVDTVLRIPRDTLQLSAKDSGCVAWKGTLYMWTGSYWSAIQGVSGGVVDLSYDQANRMITASGGGTPAILDLADYVYPGLMSAYDKRRLDSSSYLFNQSGTGDSIFTVINDSTGKFHRIAAGANMTIINDGSKLTFHASGGGGGSDSSYVTPLDFGGVNDSTTDNTVALQSWISMAGYKRLYLPTGIWRTTGRLTIPRKGMYMYGDGPTRSIIKTSYINTSGGVLNNIDGAIYGDTSWTGATMHDIGVKHSGSSATKHINQALLVCYMGVLYDASPSTNWLTENINLYNLYLSAPDVSLHGIKFYSYRSGKGGTLRRVFGDNIYFDRMGSNALDIAGGKTGDHIDDSYLYDIRFTRVTAYDLGRVGDFGFGGTLEVGHNIVIDGWDIDGAKNIAMELIKTKNSQFSNSRIRNSKASTLAIAMNGFSTHLGDENRLFNVVVSDTNSLGIQIQHQNYLKSWGNSFTNKDLVKIAGVQNSSFTGDIYDNRGTGSHTVLSIEAGSKNNIFTDITVRGDSATAGTFSSGIAFNGATTTGNLVNGANIRYGSGGGTPISESASATGNKVSNYSVNGTRFNFSKTYSESARLFNMGGYNLWFDASNNLRWKNGLPTTDTDGTIIGSGGGGTPAGADGDVQFRTGSSFDAETAFNYNKTTNELTLDSVQAKQVTIQGGVHQWSLDIRNAYPPPVGNPYGGGLRLMNTAAGGTTRLGLYNSDSTGMNIYSLPSSYDGGISVINSNSPGGLVLMSDSANIWFETHGVSGADFAGSINGISKNWHFGDDAGQVDMRSRVWIGGSLKVRDTLLVGARTNWAIMKSMNHFDSAYSTGTGWQWTTTTVSNHALLSMQLDSNGNLLLPAYPNTRDNGYSAKGVTTSLGGYLEYRHHFDNTGGSRNDGGIMFWSGTLGVPTSAQAKFGWNNTTNVLTVGGSGTARLDLNGKAYIADSIVMQDKGLKFAHFSLRNYLNGAAYVEGVGYQFRTINQSSNAFLAFQIDSTGGATSYGPITMGTTNFAHSSGKVTLTGRFGVSDQLYVAQLASDPATNLSNGSIYYNTATNKIRVYENSAWKNLASIISGSSFVDEVALTGSSGFQITGSSPQTGAVAYGIGTSLGAGPLRSTGSAGAIALGNLNLATEVTGLLSPLRLNTTGTPSSTTVLYGDSVWRTPPGSGDVVGPASVTAGKLTSFNGGTGKLIQGESGTGYVKTATGVPSYVTSIPDADIAAVAWGKLTSIPTNISTIAGLTATTNNFIVSQSSAWASIDANAVRAILSIGNVQNTALTTWTGTTTLTTLGTIGTGTWNATAIAAAYGGVPSGGSTGQILRKIDATSYNYSWQNPPTEADGVHGEITVAGGSWALNAGVVNFAKMQNLSALTFMGNSNGITGSPNEINMTQATAMLNVGTPSLKGLVPAGGTALQVLRVNAGATALEWATGGGGTTETASNGLNKVGSDIQLGGPITATVAITGAQALQLGTTGSKLSTLDINASTGVSVTSDQVLALMGQLKHSTETATDANYTWATATPDPEYVDLPAITANRTLTLPTNSDGIILVISNVNNSISKWSFTGGTVKNQAGSTIADVPYGTTRLRGNGTDWIIMGIEGTKGLIVLQANDVNSDGTANTLDDVNELNFPVIAGLTYRFKFFVTYSSAATTTGSRWTISTPATTFVNYNSEYTLTATTTTNNQALAASNLPAASNASSAATGSNIAVIEGVIRASATGTVQLRFASEVASSAITALAFRSYVEYEAIR